MAENESLLTYEIVKIIYEEGTSHIIDNEQEGFARVRSVLYGFLDKVGTDCSKATTRHFRKIFALYWEDVLDELVPFEAQQRVTARFKRLLF